MGRLRAIVLGSAAGGGYPQWNCRCDVCRLAWEGDPRVKPRTQASLAVTADGRNWTLLNASPDLRAQIAATPALHPRGKRESPISAVVLTGGEIDQIAGLLHLRESARFSLFGTGATQAALDANPVFRALAPEHVERQAVTLDTDFELAGGVSATLFAVPGKVPLYRESEHPDLIAINGENAGVELRAGGAVLIFIPGAAALNDELRKRIARADVLLFDGTLFDDDEMIRMGLGTKTGLRMGHMPIYGAAGSLVALRDLRGRRIYVHINNTNAMLIDKSAERRAVEAAGVEVAYDGMEIVL
ncbi:MAG: pyrroloquinoline quinone biosynthesis protein [Variibacter sp.]|jgi:pyrroloquinoline quinone biosynthesis protein B|nr:pyrroloquinoline quinone biosynthesis protein [Variibacter sp.]